MKEQLYRPKKYLIIGLIIFSVLSFLVSQSSMVFTKEKAVQVAVAHLEKNKIAVDLINANPSFSDGEWNVFFFVDPLARPADILVRINPLTGNAEIIPLR